MRLIILIVLIFTVFVTLGCYTVVLRSNVYTMPGNYYVIADSWPGMSEPVIIFKLYITGVFFIIGLIWLLPEIYIFRGVKNGSKLQRKFYSRKSETRKISRWTYHKNGVAIGVRISRPLRTTQKIRIVS